MKLPWRKQRTFRDITGKKFGFLTALKPIKENKHGYMLWEFRCVCGSKKILTGSEVWRGRRKTCGCLKGTSGYWVNLKHGKKGTRIYRIYRGIWTRCKNSNVKEWPRYGGRGIKLCKRWHKFENFYEDMGEPPSIRHSIDRVNNNGNYYKGNCRWALPKQQNRNAQSNICITYQGKTKCIAEWAEYFKLPYYILWSRLKNNSFKRAVQLSYKPRKTK